jgi:hypothetical protein
MSIESNNRVNFLIHWLIGVKNDKRLWNYRLLGTEMYPIARKCNKSINNPSTLTSQYLSNNSKIS